MFYEFYTTNEIKADGWLKKQLEIQAKGLSGNLDKIWPDIKDSAWIGGNKEGWERVPYWLDGFIPLAYLLNDNDMISRAKRYIDSIISFQKPDGWICPCKDNERTTYDTWATILISKVLTVYYDCSKDERIPSVIYNVMKNYYDLLSNGSIKLFDWGKYRWYEAFIALNFLYSKYPEDWIKELAKLLKNQGADYTSCVKKWKKPKNKWRFDTHVVNLAMMLKYEAVSHNLLNEEYTNEAERLYDYIAKYNGTAVKTFTGDECLSGLSPIQGTECCSVVELMYSLEILYAHTQNKKWAEILEVVAFNALPATLSDDMWTHQYDQMSNQISCITFGKKKIFRTNGPDSHLFGLEPNFGCCTANFSQGFPKLALSTYMHHANVIENVIPIPSILNDNGVTIKLETDYPFDNNFKYYISSNRNFTFKIRVPSFAENITVDGKSTTNDLCFDIMSGENKTITVSYISKPYFEERPNKLLTAKCGSLVYSLPIEYKAKMLEYEKNGVIRKYPYCDYEYYPTTKWNYGYYSNDLTFKFNGISDVPFSSNTPAANLTTTVKTINWGNERKYANIIKKRPKSTKPLSQEQTVSLFPYGSAKLRVTELPKVK